MDNRDIYLMYGDRPKEMVKHILAEARIAEEIKEGDLIGIKPNLVVAKKSELGATTDPELVAGLIEYLQSHGHSNIIVLEGSWVGARTDRAFKVCGYEELSRRYNIPLINLQDDKYQNIRVDNQNIKVCNKALEVDYLINMPVLKGHCQTRMTCALKNLKGCIPDSEKRRFHTMGLHKPIAYLSKALKQDLVIVDGIYGDLDFEEGGNPVQMNRIIVGKDPVLIDSYAAELMGHSINDVSYIEIAEQLGVGTADLNEGNIIQLNENQIGSIKNTSRKVRSLIKNVEENQACSACYGNLIHALKRLDEQRKLNTVLEKIYIGQGFKGKELNGIGIGICTKNAGLNVKGCPPSAREILDVLQSL